MPPRDGDVVEEDVAVGGAADQRSRAFGGKRFAGPPSARADDERGTAGVTGGVPLLGELVRCEAQRRLAVLVAAQIRPAARAVVRRLGILETALRAVDMPSSSCSSSLFSARMC